jgi:hypothetical protein
VGQINSSPGTSVAGPQAPIASQNESELCYDRVSVLEIPRVEAFAARATRKSFETCS